MSIEESSEYILLTTDKIKIVYEMHGFGPTILFLHGWAATRNFWFAVKELENHRTILFDMRGHGDSDKAKDYSQSRILSDIVELLEATGTTDLILVGHSLGGIIATKFAREFGEQYNIRKIILVATPPTFKISFLSRTILSFLLLVAPAVLRKTFTPKTLYEPKEDLLKFIWAESAKGSRIAYIKYLNEWNGTTIMEDLQSLDIPKVAIIPKNDRTVPAEIQEEAYRELCEIITIDNAGHNVMIEKPQEFKQALLKAIYLD